MAIIDPGLEAIEMRNRMESKGALEVKGSLYVGTGGTTTVTKSDNSTVKIPVTTAFNPPDATDENANGGVMIWDTSVNSDTGWKVGQVGTKGIEDGAITQAKLKTLSFNVTKDNYVTMMTEEQTATQDGVIRIGFYNHDPDRHLILQADLAGQSEPREAVLNLPIANGTLVTEKSLELWCHHITVSLAHQDSNSGFSIGADFVTRSNATFETFDEVLKLLKQKKAMVMTGTGNIGTGKIFYNAGSSSQQVPSGKAYVVTRGFYDDRTSSDSWCFSVATLLESSGNAYYGTYNLNAKDFDFFLVTDSVSAFASSDLFQIS